MLRPHLEAGVQPRLVWFVGGGVRAAADKRTTIQVIGARAGLHACALHLAAPGNQQQKEEEYRSKRLASGLVLHSATG